MRRNQPKKCKREALYPTLKRWVNSHNFIFFIQTSTTMAIKKFYSTLLFVLNISVLCLLSIILTVKWSSVSEVKKGLENGLHRAVKRDLDGELQYGYNFHFHNPTKNFTLEPAWLDEFFNSQPIATHNETLADPNSRFLVLTCHKVRSQK